MLKPSNLTVMTVDGSIIKPFGVVENMIVQVEQLEFLADFIIIDMEKEEKIPLILGRPFMATSNMFISVHDGRIMMREKENVLLRIGNKEDNVRIKKRARHKMSRREVASINSTTGTYTNSCKVLQVPEDKEVDKGGTHHSGETPLPRGSQVRFKNMKWIVNKIREDGLVEIRRPYTRATKRVDRRHLMSWGDEDPNRDEKT